MRWSIEMISERPLHSKLICCAAWILFCGLTGGCQHLIKPHVDETVLGDDITTATAETIRREVEQPESRAQVSRREHWPQLVAIGHSGSVTHWPLWYEDPFEDRGSEDGRFAWTWQDYLAAPASTGRWVVNALALPVTAALIPGVTLMSSDGVLSWRVIGHTHDARRGPGSDVGETESLSVRGGDSQAPADWSAPGLEEDTSE